VELTVGSWRVAGHAGEVRARGVYAIHCKYVPLAGIGFGAEYLRKVAFEKFERGLQPDVQGTANGQRRYSTYRAVYLPHRRLMSSVGGRARTLGVNGTRRGGFVCVTGGAARSACV
jgi:hypothetical protein